MTTVLFADDHAIVRQGFRRILEEAGDIQVTGEAENGAQVLSLVRSAQFDVVVLDASMPGTSGLEVLEQIQLEFPRLPVLVLSMFAEEELGVRAIRLGAAGYLSKTSAPTQLVAAIRQVAAGRRCLSPAIAEMLANAIAGSSNRAEHESLSSREFQTLQLIAAGKTLTEIGGKLNISVKTVSVYRARLLAKLELKNNAELIHYAFKHNLAEKP
jgi:DNA-binding NarL/FixJ family response regulator